EDGIRDFHVTGVQTCALPISLRRSDADWLRVTDVLGEELGFASKNTEPDESHWRNFDVYEAEILQEPLDLGAGNASDWHESGWNFSSGSLRVGTVHVGVNPEVLEKRQHAIWWSSGTVGAGMLLFTVLLINVFLGNILRPMQKLSSRVEQLILGDYGREPVVRKGVASE